MIASFTLPAGSGGSILQDVPAGHALTVNLPGSQKRVVLLVSAEDKLKLGDARRIEPTTVTDLMTGIEHTLVSAPCGLGCRCAVTFA